ncbi:MAG TPA: hypothetical protein VEX87_13805 [Skermanella sp.]|nr:hypothetical protein [Skermanella sp.]
MGMKARGIRSRITTAARGLMILAVLLGGSGPASGAAGSIVPADPPAVAAHTARSGDFDLLLSRSLDAIRAAALRDLELEAAPVHAELVGRADHYVDWVFDWWTSYILIFKAIAVGIASVATGDFINVQNRVEERLLTTVLGAYEARLQPDLARLDLEAAAAAALRSTDRRIDKLCFELNREAWAGLRQIDVPANKPDLCAGLPPLLEPREIIPPLAYEAGSRFDAVAARVTRPIMTTTASLSVSASAVVAMLGSYGIPVALIGGPVFVVIAAKSIFTIVDLVLAQLDAVVNRDSFERAVRAVLEDSREHVSETLNLALVDWIDEVGATIRQNQRMAVR